MTNDDAALHYNPWGDDDSDYRVLHNVMATTRVSHECAICFDVIPPRTRVRAQTEVWDRTCKTFTFCPACCDAMRGIESGEDLDGEALDARREIGIRTMRTRHEKVLSGDPA